MSNYEVREIGNDRYEIVNAKENNVVARVATINGPSHMAYTVCQALEVAEMSDEDRQEHLSSLAGDATQRAYWKDVRDMADSILEELKEKLREGETGEPLREWLLENIHESIDGCARVIYTQRAKECLVHSSNDSAYFDEFGGDGLDVEAGIPWSTLAYCAFKADVEEQLRAYIDLNEPENGDNDDGIKEARAVGACKDLDREQLLEALKAGEDDARTDDELRAALVAAYMLDEEVLAV